MKRGFTGKRYFAWLGWMDAQAGRSLFFRRQRRRNWPMWARATYTRAWLTYPQRDHDEPPHNLPDYRLPHRAMHLPTVHATQTA